MRALLLAVLVGTLWFQGRAQSLDIASLKGIHTVAMALDVARFYADSGLDTAAMRRHIELQFRRSGLIVVPAGGANADAYIDVLVIGTPIPTFHPADPQVWSLFVRLQLSQRVTVARLSQENVAPTYQQDELGLATTNLALGGLAKPVESSIDKIVERFLNDWLSVNPASAPR